MNLNYVFHVHTNRCGHASNETDEDYVLKAIALGASDIVFTDHAPFPGNPFSGRMLFSELESYISSLQKLKIAYRGQIDIHTGLEIEYLPSYIEYYNNLKKDDRIEVLLLGQHHYEISDGVYSFDLEDKTNEYIGLAKATIDGINSGLFCAIAHPDRIFRREKEWTPLMEQYAKNIIAAACFSNIYIEKNYNSMKKAGLYRNEFWNLVPADADIIYGCDAHKTEDIAPASYICNFQHKHKTLR